MKNLLASLIRRFRLLNQGKIFCIGQNKTGTTSLKKTFLDLRFIVGNQRKAERLAKYYLENNFVPIIDYCETAQVFQDFPFSYPETYKYLDKAFPGAKFILTIRDTPDQWYNSLVSFHSKMFGKGNIPSKVDLIHAGYVWRGWAWQVFSFLYKTPDNDLYNKDILIRAYERYNKDIISYFKERPNDLLVINLSEEGSYQTLMNFLGINSIKDSFPWENKTEAVKVKR